MVEIKVMIKNKDIFILIDTCSSIAESCNLHLTKFEKYWLVELATGTKRKVVSYVEYYEMFMSQFKTQVKLNVLHLGSYDVLIGMEWLENTE